MEGKAVKLNDLAIRASLRDYLNGRERRPTAILEELRVHNGNAIADVVAVFDEAHCYEIKSDLDNINKATIQGEFYNLAFRKITLVTTPKHLEKARLLIPSFWGLIIAVEEKGQVAMREVRKAKANSQFDKSMALMTLWKSEMLSISSSQNGKNSREIIAGLIAQTESSIKISKKIAAVLVQRHVDKSSIAVSKKKS